MLALLGLALRSASANGCGGVTRPKNKPGGKSANWVAIRQGGHAFRQRLSGRPSAKLCAGKADGGGFPMAMTGTVKFFNGERGYGFIKPDDGGRDVFVHITAVERAGLKDLAEGQRITFEVEPDKKGKGPKAVNLVLSS
jgi:CspA family cold shock protein